MTIEQLKMYYKAGVLVPFYTAIASVGLLFIRRLPLTDGVNFLEDEGVIAALHILLTSGCLGLSAMGIFLNRHSEIKNSNFYRWLSWFLLPLCFVSFIIATRVDWSVVKNPNGGEVLATILYLIVCALHVIGLIIAYTDFNASVKREQKANEKQKGLREEQLEDSLMTQH